VTSSTALPESDRQVTIVVPTRNSERTIDRCLQSIRGQTLASTVVVVDNGSTDRTRAIAEAGADAVLDMGPERSAQRNHGARSFPAEIVGFVDADMILQPTVVEEVVAALRSGAGSVIVPERTVGSGFWVEVRAFERSFYDGSDAIEAARFFRWDVFDRTGGFDEQLTGPEDWDLSESARQLAPVVRTMAVIEHDEGTISYLDACRKKAYYAEGVRRYLAKRGVAALRQASRRPWLRQPRKLLNWRGAGLIALKAGEALAVAVALGHRYGRPGSWT
jgi:glycosyltransferase involved in cell wall biosynthesis